MATLPTPTPSIGKHSMITIRGIPDATVLERVETLKPLFDAIVKECNLTVVNEAGHQFEPMGATYVYVLAESHMSIHTYPELASAYMDIFCCDLKFDEEKAYKVIREFFKTEDLNTSCLYR